MSSTVNYIDCILCRTLAVVERVGPEHVSTIFCTNRLCGRYRMPQDVIEALHSGGTLSGTLDDWMSQVYLANRSGDQVLISMTDVDS